MIVERNKVTAIATLSDWLLKPTNFFTNDTQNRNQVIFRNYHWFVAVCSYPD